MSSSRLRGKSLADLAGEPLVLRVVERVRAAALVDEVVVLTSHDPSDDELVAALEAREVPVRRGPLEDVLARFEALVEEFGPDYVVRVTGDCPLVEPSYVDAQIEALEAHDGDFCWVATPAIEGTLGGQTVLSARVLRAISASEDPLDREHVGSFFLREHADEFRVVELNVDSAYARPGLRLQVDELEDLKFVREIFTAFPNGTPSVTEVLAWIDARGTASNEKVVESAANQRLRELSREVSVRTVGSWPPRIAS